MSLNAALAVGGSYVTVMTYGAAAGAVLEAKKNILKVAKKIGPAATRNALTELKAYLAREKKYFLE